MFEEKQNRGVTRHFPSFMVKSSAIVLFFRWPDARRAPLHCRSGVEMQLQLQTPNPPISVLSWEQVLEFCQDLEATLNLMEVAPSQFSMREKPCLCLWGPTSVKWRGKQHKNQRVKRVFFRVYLKIQRKEGEAKWQREHSCFLRLINKSFICSVAHCLWRQWPTVAEKQKQGGSNKKLTGFKAAASRQHENY